MVIIENTHQFLDFLPRYHASNAIILPIFTDTKAHPAVNKICLLYVVLLESGDQYVLPFDHNDAQSLPKSCLAQLQRSGTSVYTPDAKRLLHAVPGLHALDMKMVEHLNDGLVDARTFYTPTMTEMLGLYRMHKNVYRSIPLMHLAAYAHAYAMHIRTLIGRYEDQKEQLAFHNTVLIPACQFMESSGVGVDPEVYVQHYGQTARENIVDDLVYTEYNPYTTARRVSNKWNHVNYAAIDKNSGVRQAYVSRHTHGNLVLIDWESFHVRLIADLMGYKLPNEPIHEFFAKQYFSTSEVTPEQYEEGKQITFQNLYGQGDSQLEFFQHVRQYIQVLFDSINEDGYTQTDEGNRIVLKNIEDPNPGKVFNYLLQLRETEVAMIAIHQLIRRFEGRLSRVTLYTYDSLLIDLEMSEVKSLLPSVVKIMELGGKFPVRIYAGKNYGELKNITKTIKSNVSKLV